MAGSSELSAAQRAVVFHDTLLRFILPLCSTMGDRPHPERAITNAVYLVDVASLSLKQAWGLRSYAQDISNLLATTFPEVIETIFVSIIPSKLKVSLILRNMLTIDWFQVINAPSYFSRIWSMLKGWVEPKTAEKIRILTKDDHLPILLQKIHINSIPIEFGGKLRLQQNGVPALDPEICKRVEWLTEQVQGLPEGPVKWIEDNTGYKTAVAVGRCNGAVRHQSIFRMRVNSY